MPTRFISKTSGVMPRARGRRWTFNALAASCLLFLVLLALTAPARATTLQRMSVEQMSRRSIAVVQGTVVATSVHDSAWGVRTAIRLRVDRSLKGAAEKYVTVFVPGGMLADGTRVVVDGMASFRVGDACFVFVDKRGWVVGGFQGKLQVSHGRVVATGETDAALGRRVRMALGEALPAASGAAPHPFRRSARTLGGSPTITSITPGAASAGTNSYVTINGSGFGALRGTVAFSYGRNGVLRIQTSNISSWSDTAVTCEVPIGTIDNYLASAGSGPVVVITDGLGESNGYEFRTTFGYGGTKWASPGVTYLVNPSGVDSVMRENLVDAGAAVWNAAGSAFQFADGGTTSSLYANDDLNVISWANGLPAGVIAWAQSYYSGGRVTQCDIQFSNAFAWGDGSPGSGTMDVQSITMHETGHWLRLLDQYMPGDAGKVMYGFANKDVQKRVLSAGDIAGINWVYPGANLVTGTLTGTVTTAGVALGGASVTVGGSAPVITAGDGTYMVSGLAPGAPSVTYAKTGYVSQTLSGVVITAGGATTRDVDLVLDATPPTPSDDDIPGVAIPASPFVGTVSSGLDRDDVFSIALNVGQTLQASIAGPPLSDFRLYLYAPGTVSLKSSAAGYVAVASGAAYPYLFTYIAEQSGTYYLDVFASLGVGGYTVRYSVDATAPDTVGPVCVAKNVTVRQGQTCQLRFKVHDAKSSQVSTQLAIVTKAGVVKKKWTWGYGQNNDSWSSINYTCLLAKGTYQIVVKGKDLAGNAQSQVGRAILTVQ
jgi:hypothetical protein